MTNASTETKPKAALEWHPLTYTEGFEAEAGDLRYEIEPFAMALGSDVVGWEVRLNDRVIADTSTKAMAKQVAEADYAVRQRDRA